MSGGGVRAPSTRDERRPRARDDASGVERSLRDSCAADTLSERECDRDRDRGPDAAVDAEERRMLERELERRGDTSLVFAPAPPPAEAADADAAEDGEVRATE